MISKLYYQKEELGYENNVDFLGYSIIASM